MRTLVSLAIGCCVLLAGAGGRAAEPAAAPPTVDYDVRLDTIRRGYDGKTCLVQARIGAIPRDAGAPILVLTATPLVVTGSDVYLTVHDMRSDDGGQSWSGPTLQPNLGRQPAGEIDGRPAELAGGDLWPKWHARSGKLLAIGHTFRYVDARAPVHGVQRETCYTVYDPAARAWSPWRVLQNRAGDGAYPYGAGCIQRFDLPDGDILLPVYGGRRTSDDPYTHVRVVRLAFDGETLALREEGGVLRQETKRGFAEPSLTRFRDKFYLTIRHDDAGYVCTSDDGLHFAAPRIWRWDDGAELGNYNTQTHWVAHDDALFLVYTRRGADNDHVFRHRAPLFLGQVDTEQLRVIRATERVLVPERGARLGNFGVTEVSANETWVVTSEWMQTWRQASHILPVDNPYGADNSTFAARILWKQPNTQWRAR